MIRGISNGPNARPLNDNISSSAPGIPDDALIPGEPEIDEAEVEKDVRQLEESGFTKPSN